MLANEGHEPEETADEEDDVMQSMDPARLEASRKARARLRREEKERAALWHSRRTGSASTADARKRSTPKPEPTADKVPAPPSLTLKDFEVCHATIVLRRRTGMGKYYDLGNPNHRVTVQVGCGTHLGDVRLDYLPMASPGASDLPQRIRVLGTELARMVAAELNKRLAAAR